MSTRPSTRTNRTNRHSLRPVLQATATPKCQAPGVTEATVHVDDSEIHAFCLCLNPISELRFRQALAWKLQRPSFPLLPPTLG